MEFELVKLKEALPKETSWKTKMGGLIPSWNNFHDEVNAVSRPAQMGPVWMHAATIANKKINHLLWVKDPPASSYPSCIAVKCAQLQSDEAGESLLTMLRTAAMEDGKNIAKPALIYEIAEKLGAIDSSFNLAQFESDYDGGVGASAFKEDLQEVQYYRINRFPSLLLRPCEGKTVLLQGYRAFDDMIKELRSSYPDLNMETGLK